jgi:hypothetical protein
LVRIASTVIQLGGVIARNDRRATDEWIAVARIFGFRRLTFPMLAVEGAALRQFANGFRRYAALMGQMISECVPPPGHREGDRQKYGKGNDARHDQLGCHCPAKK